MARTAPQEAQPCGASVSSVPKSSSRRPASAFPSSHNARSFISSSCGAEALGPDRGRIVPKLYEQVVGALYESRWTADEDARPRSWCRPYGPEHLCVDAPREPGPADRRLAGKRAMQMDSVGGRQGFELVAIQGVVKRAGGNEQPRIDFARARSTMTEHRHQRNKT